MAELAAGIMDRKVSKPEARPRGERVASFVDEYLRTHPGLSLGELAFRIRADKRDLQRLVRDRSGGSRLEDQLAAYFGTIFVDEIFKEVVGNGPSRREVELAQESAAIAARAERIARDRAEARRFRSDGPTLHRLPDDEAGTATF